MSSHAPSAPYRPDRTLGPVDVAQLVAAVAICQAAGGLSTLGSSTRSAWYLALEKPWFQPPSWLFAPVWITLYTLMGIAAWIVWRAPRSARRRRALGLFAVQLALNAAWTPLFFGAHRIVAAAVLLGVLLFAAAATVVVFRKVARTAGALLVPYVVWLGYALAINVAIVVLAAR